MVRRVVCVTVLAFVSFVLLVGLWVAPVGAQQYAFSVDKMPARRGTRSFMTNLPDPGLRPITRF